ncbi:MAG TPA: D-aminoacylase [Terriglobales bacterium]|nr:D-aminoacylase [Terriglobales bacterium]
MLPIPTKVVRCILTVAILLFPLTPRSQTAEHIPYDIVIVNGHILDGTGSPWYQGSLAIRNSKIADIGRIGNVVAKRTIDAMGMVVAPGFIDLHSHSDFTLLVDGKAESKIRQGVTTEIIGEHTSAGPVLGAAIERLDATLAVMGLKRSWTTLGEYFSVLQKHGMAVNIASYVGSGQVRLDVIGNVNRPPTPAELDTMKQLIDQAMRDGAIGLSSGLIYTPNAFAKTDELIELAKVAGRYGGIYTSHIRDEADHEGEALREAIEVGEKGGLPVHILHYKIAGKQNWGRAAEMTALIQSARDHGRDVTADQYPYIAASTSLSVVLPTKYLEGTHQQVVDRLRDPKTREEIRNLIETGVPGWENHVEASGGWHGVMVSTVQKSENKRYEGMRMDEVAKAMNKEPVDAVCDLLVSEDVFPSAIYFEMDDQDVRAIMREPWVGVGSDGSAVNPNMKFAGSPHPRFYGTFPRVLGEYVREQKVITLPDAIRKMTALAAQITGLTDRGLLRPGMAADITIFDLETVSDRATFENPSQYAVGIPYVIVNGNVVIDQGRHTGALPGRVLYGRGKR